MSGPKITRATRNEHGNGTMLTLCKLVLDLHILLSGHTEEMGDAVPVCVPVGEAPCGQAPW